MLLTELLSIERIKIPLVSSTKDEILAELVEVVGRNAPVRDLDDVLRAVREREEVLSTGIGNGVAIPHGKSSAVNDLALVAGIGMAAFDIRRFGRRDLRHPLAGDLGRRARGLGAGRRRQQGQGSEDRGKYRQPGKAAS